VRNSAIDRGVERSGICDEAASPGAGQVKYSRCPAGRPYLAGQYVKGSSAPAVAGYEQYRAWPVLRRSSLLAGPRRARAARSMRGADCYPGDRGGKYDNHDGDTEHAAAWGHAGKRRAQATLPHALEQPTHDLNRTGRSPLLRSPGEPGVCHVPRRRMRRVLPASALCACRHETHRGGRIP
jgi:hypothetical protein